uniref:Uncharacterized protein n=1 Tax=Cucumis melo TaxID=3656 RepID=A0A9I9EIX6_CUCME
MHEVKSKKEAFDELAPRNLKRNNQSHTLKSSNRKSQPPPNPPELEAPLFQTTDGEKDANKASNFDPKELELSGSTRVRREQSEKYRIPHGDWFEVMSSPYYLAEIGIRHILWYNYFRKLIIGLHQVNTSNVIILKGVQVYVYDFMEGERMMRIFNYKTQKHKSVIFQGVDDSNRETLSLELSKSVLLRGGIVGLQNSRHIEKRQVKQYLTVKKRQETSENSTSANVVRCVPTDAIYSDVDFMALEMATQSLTLYRYTLLENQMLEPQSQPTLEASQPLDGDEICETVLVDNRAT